MVVPFVSQQQLQLAQRKRANSSVYNSDYTNENMLHLNIRKKTTIPITTPIKTAKINNSIKTTTVEIKKDGVLLCGIAKLENHYIREWVEYHKQIGFKNICLYDNNDIDGERFEDVIGDYIDDGFVILKDVRGKNCFQISSYNLCYQEYKDSYEWIAFLDIDEFLFLDKDKFSDVNDFVKSKLYMNFNTIKLAWRTYTDSDLIKVENNNYSVTRFTAYTDTDLETKAFIRTTIDCEFMANNPHYAIGNGVRACNALGIIMPNKIGAFGRSKTYANAYIKHYRFKTIEEYVFGKMTRLWPTNYKNGGVDFLNLEFFFKFNTKTQEKLEFAKQLIAEQKKKNLTIAIVGNSPCLLKEGFGKEIDSHDLVLRFNNFPIEGYEKDMGTKTDMIAVVSTVKNYDKTDLFLSLPKENRIFRDDKKSIDRLPIEKVFNGRVTENDVTRIDEYIAKVQERMPNYKLHHYPSTGLVMMQYIIDNFSQAKIDAYGFTFFSEKKIHFYDNKSGLYHDRNSELEYFDKYLKNRIALHNTNNKKIKIAIVGNSPILKEREYGNEIDNHDIVVRFNNYTIKGFEKNVGTKTTDVCFHIKTVHNDAILNIAKEHRHFFYTYETKGLIDKELRKKYNNKLSIGEVSLIDRNKYFIKLKADLHSRNNAHASSGLIMCQMMADKYPDAQIDVYGITFFNEMKNDKKFTHLDGTQYICVHDGQAELNYFNRKLKDKINLHL